MGINTAIDITAKDLQAVKAIIKKHLPGTLVWAYGSRVKFTAKPESDLDLVAHISQEQQSSITDLQEAFDESGLPFRVDILNWNKIPESFRGNIEKEYVVIQDVDNLNKEVPNGWKKYKLQDTIDLKNGKARPKGIGEYPVYGGNGILDYTSEFNVSNETIIIGRVGAYCGSVYFEDKNIWISDNALYAKSKKGFNAKFLYYYLKDRNLNTIAGGSSHPLLTQGQLNQLNVELPSEKIQSKVASILSSLDDKIELNRQTNQTLEAIAQTLFKEMCLPKGDELPEGWKVGKLRDFYKTTSGGTPSRSKMEYYDNGTINWIKSKELGNFFVIDTEEKITETALQNSSAKLLPINSVLIAMYGATVGEISILGKSATSNQAICSVLPNEDYPFSFIYEFLKSQKESLKSMAVGGAQQNISQDVIQGIEVIMPAYNTLKEFHSLINPIYNAIKLNILETQTLTFLRDSLLPKLMKGEIEIN